MDIGDIYTVEIPPSNGHEQAGVRPAIIMQAEQFETRLPTVLLVPLTSQLRARGFPGTVSVHPDAENHLVSESVALAFQLRAIDKRRLKSPIGRLSTVDLANVRNLIKQLIQL